MSNENLYLLFTFIFDREKLAIKFKNHDKIIIQSASDQSTQYFGVSAMTVIYNCFALLSHQSFEKMVNYFLSSKYNARELMTFKTNKKRLF